jgi:hypothetical protein
MKKAKDFWAGELQHTVKIESKMVENQS